VLTASVPFTNQTLTASPHNVDASVTDTSADAVTSITQPGPTTIQFTFNTVTNVAQTFTIAGLKVNASVAPVSSTITISVTSPSVSVAATAVPMAFVSKSISTTVATAAAATSACSVAATSNYSVTNLVVTGGFPDAFHAAAEIQGSSTDTGAQATAIQGTRIAVTFNNLNNAGVNYYVPATLSGTGVTLSAYAAASGGTALTGATVNGTAGLVLLTPSTGSATIYYGVVSDTATGTQSFAVGLTEVIPSVAAVTAYSTSPVTASVTLAGVAAPGYPEYSTTQTAYTSTVSGTTTGLLTPCATTLLFPYVVNAGGFDTGVAIANASTGSGIPGISTNSGSCVVTFYGTGAATPTVVYNTGTIAAATDATFLVSVQAPGLSGYAVAVCTFLGAHGYAFITDGFGGGGRGLSADYLAIVTTSGALGVPLPTF
jgi:hypothetical protein